jgi:hypothetical protein
MLKLPTDSGFHDLFLNYTSKRKNVDQQNMLVFISKKKTISEGTPGIEIGWLLNVNKAVFQTYL